VAYDIPARDQPTLAPPGSAWKVAVMVKRARRREALFHPDDNRTRAVAGEADVLAGDRDFRVAP
jgi:hypothetical protein